MLFMKALILSLIVFLVCGGCGGGSRASSGGEIKISAGPGGKEKQESRDNMARLVKEIPPGASVAISQIYDGTNGDMTALGDRFRDRIETSLINKGFKVLPRRDLFVLMDERGLGGGEGPDLKDLKAGAVISGRYYLPSEVKGTAEFHLRALDVNENRALGAVSFQEILPQDWHKLVSSIRGNIFQKGIEQASPSGKKGPLLSARLDRKPACYPSGASVKINLSTEEGVYVYIFNLAADGTVTLLYPNKMTPDAWMPVSEFEFPPAALSKTMGLVVYPLRPEETSQETFKVVASRRKLDFSFLPVPQNEIYAGARGEKLAKLLEVLKKTEEWSEVNLSYWVGSGCGK